MFKGFGVNSFVCMDEISGCPEDLNHVIYNPNVYDEERGKHILHERIKERFNVELTDEQLNHLFTYDSKNLRDFVNELKGIISK